MEEIIRCLLLGQTQDQLHQKRNAEDGEKIIIKALRVGGLSTGQKEVIAEIMKVSGLNESDIS